MDKPRLLSDAEVEEIRSGVKSGLRGPVMSKWIEQLLADHDERVRLEKERSTPDRIRGRYGRRHGGEAATDWR